MLFADDFVGIVFFGFIDLFLRVGSRIVDLKRRELKFTPLRKMRVEIITVGRFFAGGATFRPIWFRLCLIFVYLRCDRRLLNSSFYTSMSTHKATIDGHPLRKTVVFKSSKASPGGHKQATDASRSVRSFDLCIIHDDGEEVWCESEEAVKGKGKGEANDEAKDEAKDEGGDDGKGEAQDEGVDDGNGNGKGSGKDKGSETKEECQNRKHLADVEANKYEQARLDARIEARNRGSTPDSEHDGGYGSRSVSPEDL